MRFAVVALLVLAGCAPGMPIRANYVDAEYASYAGEGTGSISGRAFVTVLGAVRFGAFRTVNLDPVTTYSTYWFEGMVRTQGTRRYRPFDPRFVAHRRTTVADVEGRFRFENVPPGSYFVTCDMWTNLVLVINGGFGSLQITLQDGEFLEDISVTQQAPPPRKTIVPGTGRRNSYR